MYQIDEVVDVWPQRQDNRVVFAGAANEEVELAEEVEWSRDAAPQFERRQDDGRQWVDARRGEAEADVAEQDCVDWKRGQF